MDRWTRSWRPAVGLSASFSVGFCRRSPAISSAQRAGEDNMRSTAALTFAAALSGASLGFSAGAHAQDAYVIGVTAAMTGPAAGTQAPVIEMLRIYVDRLNAKGGINGHRINLLVEDDQAEPSKAAASATELIRQDND